MKMSRGMRDKMPFASLCLYSDQAQSGVVCPEPHSPTLVLPVEALRKRGRYSMRAKTSYTSIHLSADGGADKSKQQREVVKG